MIAASNERGAATLPRGTRGKLLAVALLAVAIEILWLGVISPAWNFHADQAEQLQQLADRYAHLAQLTERLPQLRQEAAAINANNDLDALYLQGDSDAVAGANLQTLITDMAHRSGVKLSTVDNVARPGDAAAHQVSLRINAVAGLGPVTSFLQELVRSKPALLVDAIELHKIPKAGDDTDPSLSAVVVVHGFRNPGTAH